MRKIIFVIVLTFCTISDLMAAAGGTDVTSVDVSFPEGGVTEAPIEAKMGCIAFPRAGYLTTPEESLLLIKAHLGAINKNQREVNDAFYTAAEKGYQSVLAYLLSNATKLPLRPDQDAVNALFRFSATKEDMILVTYLTNKASPISIRPGPNTISMTLEKTAEKGNVVLVTYLLNPESNLHLTPDQLSVNRALMVAAREDHLTIVDYLLNKVNSLTLIPNQDAVNQALRIAAESNKMSIVEYLLNKECGLIFKPSPKVIRDIYEDLEYQDGREEIRKLLEPYLPDADGSTPAAQGGGTVE